MLWRFFQAAQRNLHDLPVVNENGQHEATQAIGFSTLGLLLGMMFLVALLEPIGFFEYLAAAALLSERTRAPITSVLWNRRGLPVMLVTCAVASFLFVLIYPLLIR